MLRGERQALSEQERTKILRHRISYLADDLVIPTWNAAFVYDTPAGAQAALEILEFANSQLLEFRYYDELLDGELASIYARLQRPALVRRVVGSRYTRAARQVHALFIDVNELTDRTENALKFVGDIYAARLFCLVADRLGLATWKANVAGEAEDARRHLPLRGRAVGDVARPVPRADDRADPGARAGAVLHGDDEVTRNLHGRNGAEATAF